jgi:uncharacterized protein (TIGR03084 family)
MEKICRDLNDQYRELDTLVSGLSEKKWVAVTPFCGWTIFDQVAHIAFFDQRALLAIKHPKTFAESVNATLQLLSSEGEWPQKTNPLLGPDRPEALMDLWRKTRTTFLNRLRGESPQRRIAWYGPEMSALSFATARIMETWAHTQDVYDALRLERVNASSLRHVAHLGVATFAWSFQIRQLPPPDIKPFVDLVGPSGERWVWGDPNAEEIVQGSADEFCLVVTQRRIDASEQHHPFIPDTRWNLPKQYVTSVGNSAKGI